MNKKAKGKKRGAWYDIWRALKANKLAVVCMIIIGILLFLSIFADVIFDYENVVIKQDIMNDLQKPSAEHWFGTDALGRDYFARVLYATRVTLLIALLSVLMGVSVSILVGGMAAYIGGAFDTLLMRFLDIIMAIPQTLMIIVIIIALGNNLFNICLTLAVCIIPGLTRIVRAEIMMNMQNEYVEAARAAGAGPLRILLTHLLPNSMGTILVRATSHFSGCILSTASLGYLGLGVKAPAPEWGRMLSEAQEYIRLYPHLILIPGIFIMISATSFSLLGDAIRDAMDPRLRGYRKVSKRKLARRK